MKRLFYISIVFLVLTSAYSLPRLEVKRKDINAGITTLVSAVANKNAVLRSMSLSVVSANHIYIFYGSVAEVASAPETYKMFEWYVPSNSIIFLEDIYIDFPVAVDIKIWCSADPASIMTYQNELINE
jgi:hypothetical protein